MQIGDRIQHLSDQVRDFAAPDAAPRLRVRLEAPHQITAPTSVRDDAEEALLFDDLVNLEDVRMVEPLLRSHLPEDILGSRLNLVNKFHRVLSRMLLVALLTASEDDAERALAEHAAEDILVQETPICEALRPGNRIVRRRPLLHHRAAGQFDIHVLVVVIAGLSEVERSVVARVGRPLRGEGWTVADRLVDGLPRAHAAKLHDCLPALYRGTTLQQIRARHVTSHHLCHVAGHHLFKRCGTACTLTSGGARSRRP
mmetsp:Transcript_60795/g.199079  ORF Transcript_60795/g.199079 Transcript_60795/m.199079 type:complete len:256 (+) Transcript_60795:2223-2990(+)